MLKELHIRNLAIIGDLSLEFGPGYSVLTGETGAGKSMLIDGLNLALGEKADKEMVRAGQEEALVEALFDISGLGDASAFVRSLDIPSMGDEVVLRRVVSAAGRSRCAVNGSAVPQAMLKKLGDMLVDLHGQHEHQLLLNPATHLEFLDAFGDLLPDRTELRGVYLEWKSSRTELDRLRAMERDRAARIDQLEYQVQELEAARLKPGEEESLAAERKMLANVQKISAAMARAYSNLMGDGGGRELVGTAISDLRSVEDYNKETVGPLLTALERLLDGMLDEGANLRSIQEKLEADPKRLEQIEERLDQLARLRRKYGDSVEVMSGFLAKAKAELSELSSSDERIKALEGREAELRREMAVHATRLSAERQRNANVFADIVSRELQELALEGADFGVKLIQQGDPAGPVEVDGSPYRVTETGIDAVEFYIAPNVGAGTHPLKEIASGGELSRVMLALKSILARVDRVGTMVFDEIDAGIGGRVAEIVGRKLAGIGEKRQVLCITHLPQLAARAADHLVVSKATEDGETVVRAKRVSKKDRVRELARMLAGEEITDTALKHAEALLKDG